jgi:RNA polymerase sigma factor (sigma-70 family)
MSTNVAIVDDHRLFREGLRALIGSTADLKVVAEAANSEEALPAVRTSRPEVVVLDLMLPGISGIALARELLKEDPGRRVLALSMAEDEAHVADALRSGVLGYCSKRQSAAAVLEAIRTVARGERYLAPELSELTRPAANAQVPAALATLTPREREIFELCVSGMASKEIAQHLHISPRTVETHRARILRKLGARSAVDLVRLAARSGLLPA